VRVVTWSCRGASAKSAVWDYLLELNPDVAFLQYVRGLPKTIESRYSVVQRHPVRQNGAPQRYTNAVLVRGSIGNPIRLQGGAPWVDAELDRFAGNLVGLELQPDCGPSLKAICVYNPYWPVDRKRLVGIDVTTVRTSQNLDVWVSDLLWAALCLKKPQPDDPWVMAGTFNTCETFDSWKGGPRGGRENLDRMSKLGLVDCLRSARERSRPPSARSRKGRSQLRPIIFL
jgi:hypothetical protein